MNERILNLLSLCLQAKEKGHDCFFDYQPHVGTIEISVWLGGWEGLSESSIQFSIRIDGHAYEGCWNDIGEVETYIKELIKWQAQD